MSVLTLPKQPHPHFSPEFHHHLHNASFQLPPAWRPVQKQLKVTILEDDDVQEHANIFGH